MVVIGGTSLMGGSGSIGGTVVWNTDDRDSYQYPSPQQRG